MSGFEVMTTSRGFPCILLDGFKYRKIRVTVYGEVVWRCTRKSCVGSVRTDGEVRTLLEVNGNHDHAGADPPQSSLRRRPATTTTTTTTTAPQPPPPPAPKPAQQQQPQLKRPMMMKPLAPKPRPASPPQPPPPPPEVCLRWNSYHSNMQATFPALLNNQQFVDVTLACEGRSIKCHKMILSACSSYFDELLSQNPCQHPIVLMKDLKFWEVQALVEFMYRGEVNVGQDKLPFLLAAAEALQIKGLASPTSSTPQHGDDESTSLGVDPDFADDFEAPSPSSARRSRKRRTSQPLRTTPPPAVHVRSSRPQRTNNNNNNHHPQHRVNALAQPSTSGYVPASEPPPPRRRRLETAEFEVGDHVMREIKLEPLDIDSTEPFDSTYRPSDRVEPEELKVEDMVLEQRKDEPTTTTEGDNEEDREGREEMEEEEEEKPPLDPGADRTTLDPDHAIPHENGPQHADTDNTDGDIVRYSPAQDIADPVLEPTAEPEPTPGDLGETPTPPPLVRTPPPQTADEN